MQIKSTTLLEVFMCKKLFPLLFFVCLVLFCCWVLICVFVCAKSFRKKKNKLVWGCPDNTILLYYCPALCLLELVLPLPFSIANVF